jgi:hypothetical protein
MDRLSTLTGAKFTHLPDGPEFSEEVGFSEWVLAFSGCDLRGRELVFSRSGGFAEVCW